MKFSLGTDTERCNAHISAMLTSNSVREVGPRRACCCCCSDRIIQLFQRLFILSFRLTTAAKEVGEHIEWVGMLLASLMSSQTFLNNELDGEAKMVTKASPYFAMSIVYLTFLAVAQF